VVLCPSDFAAKEIKRYGCTTPTVVVSNGVVAAYQDKNLQKNTAFFTILTVGRNAAEKRQNMLIEAVSKSKYKNQIKIQIIGDGPKRNALQTLANAVLPNQVEFNYLPTEQVIDYYNLADLYVHCAAVEVECMTALEAMACGLPILVSDSILSATKQFALNEDFLFSDVEELTQKIDTLYENRNMLYDAKLKYLERVKTISYRKFISKINQHLSICFVIFFDLSLLTIPSNIIIFTNMEIDIHKYFVWSYILLLAFLLVVLQFVF
jgi:1,2-diacylglycerol 3-alpha-glucosyltransferase